MKVIVTTASGSRYTLDPTAMTWSRENEKGLRWLIDNKTSEAGRLTSFPEIIIGESMWIMCEDDESPQPLVIRTTSVRNFENVED